MSAPAGEWPAAGRGLVALGDSITRADGEAMLGLRMQSWALWLAEALGLPFTCLARNGSRVRDVLSLQVPRLRGPYDLGCLYVGVNDVRAPEWDAARFERDLAETLPHLSEQARRLLVLELPTAIGRPPAPAGAIAAANRIIREHALQAGALVLGETDMQIPWLMLPDAVHLTARGEAELARRAAARLELAGMAVDGQDLARALEPLGMASRVRFLAGAGARAQVRDRIRLVRERPSGRLVRRPW
jgi:lysophospholipase L1-like esterase